MTTLVPCKVCGKEISTNANACPNCGESIKKSSLIKTFIIMPVCVIVALLIFLPYSCGQSKKETSIGINTNELLINPSNVKNDLNQSTKKQTKDDRQILEVEIGTVFRTDKFEIQISSVELRSSVGKSLFISKSSEGGDICRGCLELQKYLQQANKLI